MSLCLSMILKNKAHVIERCLRSVRPAARKAIALRTEYAEAYSNIYAAENVLGHFLEARKAGEEAVRLQPSNQLAINNLMWSRRGLNQK